MRRVPITRTAEPYRDPTPGIRARLAELRAGWATKATQALAERELVIHDRAGHLAMARALSLGQVLIVVTGMTLWLHGLAQPEVVRKCGSPSLLGPPFLVILIVLPLWLLALYARWQGARTGAAQATRVVDATTGDTSAELECLANETPDARVEAHVQRLRGQDRFWSQVASGLPLVLLPILVATTESDPSAMADAALLGLFPLGLLAIGLGLVLVPRLVSTWWAVLPLTLALAILAVSTLFGVAAVVLAIVQSSIVAQRLMVR
jgi:hypothetical protein